MELSIQKIPGMTQNREVAAVDSAKGAGIAIGVAVVSGVAGMAIGARWSGLLFVAATIGVGYALAERHPNMGAVVMGSGMMSGLVMLLSWVGSALGRSGIAPAAGIGDAMDSGRLPPSVFSAYRSVEAHI